MRTCVCARAHTHITHMIYVHNIFTHTYDTCTIYLHTQIYIYICVCIYIYIYTHINIHNMYALMCLYHPISSFYFQPGEPRKRYVSCIFYIWQSYQMVICCKKTWVFATSWHPRGGPVWALMSPGDAGAADIASELQSVLEANEAGFPRWLEWDAVIQQVAGCRQLFWNLEVCITKKDVKYVPPLKWPFGGGFLSDTPIFIIIQLLNPNFHG